MVGTFLLLKLESGGRAQRRNLMLVVGIGVACASRGHVVARLLHLGLCGIDLCRKLIRMHTGVKVRRVVMHFLKSHVGLGGSVCILRVILKIEVRTF